MRKNNHETSSPPRIKTRRDIRVGIRHLYLSRLAEDARIRVVGRSLRGRVGSSVTVGVHERVEALVGGDGDGGVADDVLQSLAELEHRPPDDARVGAHALVQRREHARGGVEVHRPVASDVFEERKG